MEIKKSNHANLEKKKHSIFLLSLVIASGFILTAFEWATYEVDYQLEDTEVGALIEEEIVAQELEIIRKSKPIIPIVQQEIIDTFRIDNELDTTPTFIAQEFDTSSFTDPIDPVDSAISFTRTPPVVVKEPFTIVEEMPQYQGGEKALFRYLASQTKYTIYAREMRAEGKIYIQFVVEKDGSITNAKVAQGLEPGLDRNALETVKNMKKWIPGKQLGQPVRVKLILPFDYRLM